ncbi:uncharacterized protein ATNIH1004_008063 [Aspergillus tanneri]|uniref:Peptide transporter ptr2 n=1 Tax=Aspergillus tanneri TaxID=1220188 RepID=A0A5M9MMU6_9EURO|nr:uncharacterized protein ATNIH1004_008063 [Aspergillus tanneri]KAA8646630.1 hypothetical protein ATNIH1004_008063 [Aspergillus tanneri]
MLTGEPTTTTSVEGERTPLLSARFDGAADDEGTTLSITKPNNGLRRIADSLPLSVWLIATIELCERFAYFGTVAPMQNYIQNPRNDPLRPGVIGLGQASATMVNQAFMLWCYITPVVGAVVAEQYIGRAATMETHGVPNDIMPNIDPITVLILLPILDRVVFPFLRRLGVSIRHVDRIKMGFLICGLSMLYAAFVQRTIYAAPPCYDHPRAPDCMGGEVPNRVSVFLQSPAYVLVAISEILASVAGVEYAYTQAPKSMKSLIMAVYLSAVSAGALIAMTVSPLTVDPKLPWIIFGLGVGNHPYGSDIDKSSLPTPMDETAAEKETSYDIPQARIEEVGFRRSMQDE